MKLITKYDISATESKIQSSSLDFRVILMCVINRVSHIKKNYERIWDSISLEILWESL